MLRDCFMGAVLAVALVTIAPARVHADDAEAIARHRHQRAIEALGETAGDAPLEAFAREHLDAAYRDSFAPGALLELLRSMQRAAAGAGGVLVGRDGDATWVRFLGPAGETQVTFGMQMSVPYFIVSLTVETGPSAEGARVDPITWNTLEARLDEEARAGFSGAVCVIRDGKVVLDRGYGWADRAKKIANDGETIFAIGSTPIDFTHAAILVLEDMHRLGTGDPITKFLPDVPADKRTITIDQLMDGQSGLADFHHIRGVDADPDLSWIDRDTAVKRILGGELLFAPGTANRHSHSAWVLLAAIVEIVSGQSYGEFVRAHIFEPAGMTRTGLHEDLARVDDREIAIGYEAQSYGDVNSPKYWGRTSWLVMGSGGMYSTPRDLCRFRAAVRGTTVLSKDSVKKFGSGSGLMVGGDDRGFLCMYAGRGDDVFVLCSNAHTGPGDQPFAVGRRLADMVLEK